MFFEQLTASTAHCLFSCTDETVQLLRRIDGEAVRIVLQWSVLDVAALQAEAPFLDRAARLGRTRFYACMLNFLVGSLHEFIIASRLSFSQVEILNKLVLR